MIFCFSLFTILLADLWLQRFVLISFLDLQGFSTLIYSKLAVCSCRAGDMKCLRGEHDVESKHAAQTVKSPSVMFKQSVSPAG